MGPRISSFTPRLSGEIATNLFFCFTLLPIGLPNYVLFFLGGLCSFYVLSSSKFGVQALFFITPLVSILSLSLIPICGLLLGITLLSILSNGTFLDSMKQQLGHLTWYFLLLAGLMVLTHVCFPCINLHLFPY